MLPFRYNRGIGKNIFITACLYIKKSLAGYKEVNNGNYLFWGRR